MSREKRNAVETKSGNAVVPSAPVLRKPTLPVTAGRTPEASLGSAKRGREFEGRALIGGEAAVPPASFNGLESNRDNTDVHRILRRGPRLESMCGHMSLRGVPKAHGGGATRFARINCDCWNCKRCGPKKANRYRFAICDLAERKRLNILLTLTLDPKKLNGANSTRYINRVFAHFRTYLKRRLKRSPTYVRVLEFQKNGNAHLHLLLHDYVAQAWISEAWSQLGGGRVVDIRRVSMRRVSHYLSKYLTKDLILSAPKGARRVTTSRDLTLNPKRISDHVWTLLRTTITRLYEIHWRDAINVRWDGEGNVVGFDLAFENVSKGFSKNVEESA